MSATVVPSVPTTQRPRWGRIVLRSLLTLAAVVVIAVAVGATWFYLSARMALPQADGTLALAGLHAPVTVTRDHFGVPTIEASSLNDLFFAQGFITAQDRFFQMELLRRFAGGTLAEVLGNPVVKYDREARILGMRQAAERAARNLTGESLAASDAYTRGVNAYLEAHRRHLPMEFLVLNYSPQPWTNTDTFLIFAFMVKDLNHEESPGAILREKIAAMLGPELTADLFVNRSEHDQVPSDAAKWVDPNAAAADSADEEDLPDDSAVDQRKIRWNHGDKPERESGAEYRDPLRPGSNDWVVSGAHTTTGKPLLCNDMHLRHQMPGIWYEAHLRTADGKFDVAGVTLPGTPGVVVGHNQRIAWGFTNVGPTVGDYYIENFNGNGEYQTPDGWKKPETREEVIRVKGEPDQHVTVLVTRHGPIISELLQREIRKIALRWTMYEPDALHNALLDMDRAQNWQEFTHALAGWDAPGQNIVYADVDGHIGYHATGRIPIRANGSGSLPASGADNAHEWTGWVPFDQLPNVYDPPSGIIATANGRIVPDNYKYSLSNEWAAPWRAARIYQVLESGQKFGPAEMLALQTDTYSAIDHEVAQQLLAAADRAPKLSERALAAVSVLRNWDGQMSADSAAPTIEYKARTEAMRLLLEPKLGAVLPDGDSWTPKLLNWKSYQWEMSSVWLENVLQQRPTRWLPSAYKSYDDLLVAALEGAVAAPDAPKDLASWSWGEFHAVDVEHPVFSHIPLLANLAAPGKHKQSGSGLTVKAVGSDFGPSERYTADTSNWDRSTLNITTGESGQLFSPHALDMWPLWYEGRTTELPFSAAAVEKNRQHRLVLEPK